jgi:hypothetical protein
MMLMSFIYLVFYQIRFKIFIWVYNINALQHEAMHYHPSLPLYLPTDSISKSRSTAREEIPRKLPREPHVFPIRVTSLDSTTNKHGVQRQVRRCRRRRNFIYYIEYFRKAADILLRPYRHIIGQHRPNQKTAGELNCSWYRVIKDSSYNNLVALSVRS